MVVGGLGLGYTAQTVLDDPRVRSLVVVDALEAVIGWHERGLVPVSVLVDERPGCRLVHGDFFAMSADEGWDDIAARATVRRGRRRHRPLAAPPAAPEPRVVLLRGRRTTDRGAAAARRRLHAVVERPARQRLPGRAAHRLRGRRLRGRELRQPVAGPRRHELGLPRAVTRRPPGVSGAHGATRWCCAVHRRRRPSPERGPSCGAGGGPRRGPCRARSASGSRERSPRTRRPGRP